MKAYHSDHDRSNTEPQNEDRSGAAGQASQLDTHVSLKHVSSSRTAQLESHSMRHRLAAILPVYLGIFTFSYAAATALRFDFVVPAKFQEMYWSTLPLVLLVKFGTSWTTAEWRRTYRFVTVLDMVFVCLGTMISSMVLLTCNLLLPENLTIPRSILLVDSMISLLLMTVMRFAYRTIIEIALPMIRRKGRSRTLIYGVDSQSIGILQMVNAMHSRQLPYRVVGFVCESAKRHNSLIAGVPVHHPSAGWEAIRAESRARELLIPSSMPGRVIRSILRECSSVQINVHIIPTVEEMVTGRFKLAARDVTVSDLLRREPNQLDMGAIQNSITGKRVMVTGGAGSIGSELCRQLLDLSPESLIIYDQSEFGVFSMEQEFSKHPASSDKIHYYVADILDQVTLDRVMTSHRPEIIFHAAAYKHVPLMEDNPQAALSNNVFGTKAVADAARRHHVGRFVQISTDKAVRPSSVMGATKLIAEKYVQALSRIEGTHFITVRFGNVLNSMGSVVPTFRRQIEQGGPITVTHPAMNRFFMTIPEAVQLVIQAGALGSNGNVLILDMGEPVKIVDLAKDMIMLSGLRYPEDIDIEYSGLRPGEKLYEELFYDSEKGAQRIHEKIFCGTSEEAPTVLEINATIDRLRQAGEADAQTALRELRQVIQDFAGIEWTPSRLKAAA